jgi:hypothetical protein
MVIGPVQLIVLGFRDPDFHGEIIAGRSSAPTTGRGACSACTRSVSGDAKASRQRKERAGWH